MVGTLNPSVLGLISFSACGPFGERIGEEGHLLLPRMEDTTLLIQSLLSMELVTPLCSE